VAESKKYCNILATGTHTCSNIKRKTWWKKLCNYTPKQKHPLYTPKLLSERMYLCVCSTVLLENNWVVDAPQHHLVANIRYCTVPPLLIFPDRIATWSAHEHTTSCVPSTKITHRVKSDCYSKTRPVWAFRPHSPQQSSESSAERHTFNISGQGLDQYVTEWICVFVCVCVLFVCFSQPGSERGDWMSDVWSCSVSGIDSVKQRLSWCHRAEADSGSVVKAPSSVSN